MTNREQAKKLYAGKTFYIKNPDGTLDGPREDIYYAVRKGDSAKGDRDYAFLQVINGTPVAAFTEDEIVVKMENENGK